MISLIIGSAVAVKTVDTLATLTALDTYLVAEEEFLYVASTDQTEGAYMFTQFPQVFPEFQPQYIADNGHGFFCKAEGLPYVALNDASVIQNVNAPGLPEGNILVGSADDIATAVAPSGGITSISAAGVVTLAPSKVVTLAEYSYAGGSATFSIPVSGMTAGSKVMVTIVSVTEGASIASELQATANTDAIDVTMAADPGASVFTYIYQN